MTHDIVVFVDSRDIERGPEVEPGGTPTPPCTSERGLAVMACVLCNLCTSRNDTNCIRKHCMA
ncbi:hypothetical protein DPMN_157142 [Dreissena polymorpha]|uniref:Uncharacterized protein n=1 Tax=Dreissena polymorpha TaxID=45954 RepID=A0A9D4EJS7_DREPO|nr:hypothetical protein DPMN_157142 [Dreissena polymorpha]